MPYPLLPGSAQIRVTRANSTPYIVAAALIVIGSAAYILIPAAGERQPAAAPPIATQLPLAAPATAVTLDAHQDDLVLHLHQAEDAIRRAVQQVETSQRLTTAAARTLENSGLPVQARRAQTASDANVVALEYLRNALEQLDVLSHNTARKEN